MVGLFPIQGGNTVENETIKIIHICICPLITDTQTRTFAPNFTALWYHLLYSASRALNIDCYTPYIWLWTLTWPSHTYPGKLFCLHIGDSAYEMSTIAYHQILELAGVDTSRQWWGAYKCRLPTGVVTWVVRQVSTHADSAYCCGRGGCSTSVYTCWFCLQVSTRADSAYKCLLVPILPRPPPFLVGRSALVDTCRPPTQSADRHL